MLSSSAVSVATQTPTASDFRESGGIIKISRFNLTEQDIENLSEAVRYLKQEKKISRQVEDKGFEIGD